MSDRGTWRSVGPHRYRCEEGFLHWEPHGQVLLPHAQEVVRALDGLGAHTRHVVCLFDQRDAIPIHPYARKRLVQYVREVRPQLTVVFVANSLLVRTVNQLAIAGVRLLANYDLHHHNFDNLDDALVCIERLRAGAKP